MNNIMHIATLSGWGQAADALSCVVSDTVPLDYAAYSSEEAFRASAIPSCEILVGWSLGGQLAIKAIAEGRVKPKILVLIATPFRFEDDQFNVFVQGVKSQPEQSLKRFRMLMAKGDSNAKHVIRHADSVTELSNLAYWLGVLKIFNAGEVDFANFPKTLIIHGDQDSIVPITQAEIFNNAIKGSVLMMLEQCGHAPHLHDTQAVKAIIEKFSS